MKQFNKKALLYAAVTGIMLSGACKTPQSNQADSEIGQCHGVNVCRGQGACEGVTLSGKKYDCAGKNECKGQGWLKISKKECSEKKATFKSIA